MGFEMPDLNNQPEENEEPVIEAPKKEEPDRLKNVKKIAGIVALGATVLATEGCDNKSIDNSSKQNGSNTPHNEKTSIYSETRKSRIRENYDLSKKQSSHESKMIIDNMKIVMDAGKLSNLDLSTNAFLKYYYQSLNGGDTSARISDEARQMRVLEIAKKKGIELDLSERVSMSIEGGIVPINAEINGVVIPITESDYTPRELDIVRQVKNVQNFQPSVEDGNSPVKNKSSNLRGSKPIDIGEF